MDCPVSRIRRSAGCLSPLSLIACIDSNADYFDYHYFKTAPPSLREDGMPAQLQVGTLLIASLDLEDPNFYRTVILLIQYSQ